MLTHGLPQRATLRSLTQYIAAKNGMLVFKNEEAFKYVVDFLHRAVKVVSQYNLNLNYFDEYDYVLEQFESILGHYSLRRYVASEARKLIRANHLTPDNDPDNLFFPDKIIRSVVNVNMEVAIGAKVLSVSQMQRIFQQMHTGDVSDGAFVDENATTLETLNDRGTANKKAGGGTLTVSGIFIFDNGINKLSKNFKVSFVTPTADCISDFGYKYNWRIYSIDNNNNVIMPALYSQDGVGDSINYTFPKPGWYKVCVQAYNDVCKSEFTCKVYYISWGSSPSTPTCCKAYDLAYKVVPYGSKKEVRCRLLLMTFQPVLPYTSITAATRTWKKGPLGLVWWPHKVSFISVRLSGYYNELWCNGPYKTIPAGTVGGGNSGTQANVIHYSFFAPIFVHYNSIMSEHTFSDPASNSLQLLICNKS